MQKLNIYSKYDINNNIQSINWIYKIYYKYINFANKDTVCYWIDLFFFNFVKIKVEYYSWPTCTSMYEYAHS